MASGESVNPSASRTVSHSGDVLIASRDWRFSSSISLASSNLNAPPLAAAIKCNESRS